MNLSTSKRIRNRSRTGLRNLMWICMLITALGWIVILGDRAVADTIWLRGKSEPVYGRVMSEDDVKIVFRYHANSKRTAGTSGTVDIERTEIELLVRNIRPDQLLNLNPEQPGDYRMMAEELSSQAADWEARDLAIRLYLIAVAESSGEAKLSSLNGLISLARSRSERIKFETLRYLVSDSEESLPKFREATGQRRVAVETRKQLLELVRAIRKNEGARALQLMNRKPIQEAFEQWDHVCTLAELNRFARSNRPPLAGLMKLMEIERQLLESEQGGTPETGAFFKDSSWAGQSSETAVPFSLPTIRNVTEFDPTKNVFTRGQWTTPDQKSKLRK